MNIQNRYRSLSKTLKLAIIFSIVWALVVGINDYNETTKKADNFSNLSNELCLQSNQNDFAKCDSEKIESHEIWTRYRAANALTIAVLPLPFFWLYGFILLYLFRIFRTGFKSEVNYQSLTLRGKASVILCCVIIGVTILFSALVVGNLYTNTKVPVTLSAKVPMIFDNYSDKNQISMVSFNGTWDARSPSGELVEVAFPIQASQFNCYKDRMECIESRVELSGRGIMNQLLIYEINKWSSTEINFTDTGLCGRDIYTVNLVTEKVTGINEKISSNIRSCASSHEKFKERRYELVNGFDVYWREYRKARPWFLKILQSPFQEG